MGASSRMIIRCPRSEHEKVNIRPHRSHDSGPSSAHTSGMPRETRDPFLSPAHGPAVRKVCVSSAGWDTCPRPCPWRWKSKAGSACLSVRSAHGRGHRTEHDSDIGEGGVCVRVRACACVSACTCVHACACVCACVRACWGLILSV